MGRFVKSCFWLLLLVFGGLAADAQPPPAPEPNPFRFRVGLELVDAAHQGAHLRFTCLPRAGKRMEFAANFGYSLWRAYRYLGSVRDVVHGPYGSVGLQWRIPERRAGAWLIGGFLTMGGFRHDATATIPNYYGDIVKKYNFQTGYFGLQLLVSRSYEWRRWRLDGGLRISYCQSQSPEIAFHSYQPGIGRSNMWLTRPNIVPSILVYPFLALSFGLR